MERTTLEQCDAPEPRGVSFDHLDSTENLPERDGPPSFPARMLSLRIASRLGMPLNCPGPHTGPLDNFENPPSPPKKVEHPGPAPEDPIQVICDNMGREVLRCYKEKGKVARISSRLRGGGRTERVHDPRIAVGLAYADYCNTPGTLRAADHLVS